MSIRTTVTLDEDVLERVKAESKSRGTSFRETLNELVRLGLLTRASRPARTEFRVKPTHMGLRPGLNYDCVESLIEWAEGPEHK
jgi:hypothetical protein